MGEPRLGRADAREEDVGPRVDHERHAGRLGALPRRPHALRLERHVEQPVAIGRRVLEVQSRRARGDHFPRRLRRGLRRASVTGFHVGGDRHPDPSRDPPDGRHHLRPADALAVRIAECERDPRAGGRERGEASRFDDAGGDDVPDVREDEDARALVQAPQDFDPLALRRAAVHRGLSWPARSRGLSRPAWAGRRASSSRDRRRSRNASSAASARSRRPGCCARSRLR